MVSLRQLSFVYCTDKPVVLSNMAITISFNDAQVLVQLRFHSLAKLSWNK